MPELLAILLAAWVTSQLPAPTLTRAERAEFPEHPQALPAFRYATLSDDECLAEARGRDLPFAPGPKVPTISAPVRLNGPMHGVSFEHWNERVRATLKDGPVMDCRLLLALDDTARVAAARGIVNIGWNSAYRGRWAKPGQRHPSGVAIDVNTLRRRDGSVLSVKEHFRGAGIGSRTCGLGAPPPPTEHAAELRGFVCDLHALGLFKLILTPHYDAAHADHFHLEVRRRTRWRLTQ